MVTLHQAETEQDRQHVRALFTEYMHWNATMFDPDVLAHFGPLFSIDAIIEDDMRTLDKFAPPHGRLMLAQEGDEAVGVACLKPLRDDIGEVKRMFVRPTFQRRGIGRALLTRVIDEARQIGYASVRLDSARFMTSAHSLYRSVGFRDIEPYPESEVPASVQWYWVFMEIPLERQV